jgi:membrane protein
VDRVKALAVTLWDFAKDFRAEWSKDRVGGLAAEIAFFAVLGVFPAVIVLAAALGSAEVVLGEDGATEIEDWILEQMTKVFGADNSLGDTVADLFEGDNASAFTIGAVLAVYAASRGFVAVVRALDVAYDHDHLRGWLSTRLIGLGLTVLTVLAAAVVTVLIVVGPLFGSGTELADDLGVGGAFATLWDWFRWPVVLAVLVGWAATVFHIAPNHRSPWRHELPGALIATGWWIAVSLGFSTYLDAASSGSNAVFGLLGGALSLLFWFYLMAMGLLVGAEVNSLLAVRYGIELTRPARLARPRFGRGGTVPSEADVGA